MQCYLSRAQKYKSNNVILLQASYVESEEVIAETKRPGTDGSEEELVFQSDIWAVLRNLRDLRWERKK